MNSTVTEMKNPVEEIKSRITGRRMHKWAGRQGGGNHCHGIEFLKKEWREMRTVKRPLE